MGLWEKISSSLTAKEQILDQLAVNTETQGRFIQERKLKGLNRLLREREALIQKLMAINEALTSDQSWKNMPGLLSITQAIAAKQQKVMERSNQVLQQAIAERAAIAAELRKSKLGRQVKSQYVNPWAIMTRGRRINEKG